jgi:hypothetical protein
LLIVTGESTTGTADERRRGAGQRHRIESEQMTSNVPWLKTKRDPVEMSVAERGSSALAPVEIAERGAVEQDLVVQLRCQLGSPQPVETASPVRGLNVRETISPWTSRFRKRCSYSSNSLSP